MSLALKDHGYEICCNVIDPLQIEKLRHEADIVTKAAGTTCVRHLRSRSSIFDSLSLSETFLSLLPKGLRPVRSILFDKTATENWPVLWHQDLTIAVTEKHDVAGYAPWSHKDGSPHVQPPVSLLENMVTLRLHLDDTTASNGALRVISGSHKNGKILPSNINDFDEKDVTTCECLSGDVLLMSPLILHSSRRSKLPSHRRVIHFEYARDKDLDNNLQWFENSLTHS